jgi:hypothetical protein
MKKDEPEPAKPVTVNDLLLQIESETDSDIYMYAGPVAVKSEREFNQCLVKNKKRNNATVWVTTYGGSADVAYQLVRSVRRNYAKGRFTLFVDSVCKSAGTLIALGADEIVMSDTAELGPLDIQLQKPGELGELVSGLTATQALSTLRDAAFEAFEAQFLQLRFKSGGAISTKLAAELAVKLVTGLFRPVYGQFDPMRLGENTRANRVAQAYGERIKTANVKDDTLEGLINNYPSHGFAIDRDEAAELFNKVREPSKSERHLGKALFQVFLEALSGEEPVIQSLRGKGVNDDNAEDDSGEDSGKSSGEEGLSNAESKHSNSDPANVGSSQEETAGDGQASQDFG